LVWCGWLSSYALADLVGGGYTTDTNLASWNGSPAYVSIPNASLSGASVAQGVPGPAGGATYTMLSEVVTPTTTFQLGAVSIIGSFGDTTANPVKLHLYSIGQSGGANFFSSSDAFYFAGTDLLANGTGAGLNIAAGGSGSGTRQIRLDLSNGPSSNDQPTLTAGTSYAVEFWVPANATTSFFWDRNGGSPADPGGQMFAKNNATDFGTSRNTIAAAGLAGGSPRIAAVALYPVPEPGSLGLICIGAAAFVACRGRA
jgi:hypothetical protein